MNSMDDIEKCQSIVKASLEEFLRNHLADSSLNQIDDILLSYIVNVAKEDVIDGSNEDETDSEMFIEMLEAYIPGFSSISKNLVNEWISSLASIFTGSSKNNEDDKILASIVLNEGQLQQRNKFTNSEEDLKNRIEPSNESDENDEEISKLIEMFPDSCKLEVHHCFKLSNGNTEQAAQLILHRQDIGDTIQASTQNISSNSKNSRNPLLDDKKVKDNIIAKYSYVDSSEDVKEHRPIMPKTAPKKLIRYRENKIVSLKGERFTDVKKEETEGMKKTYINLKPARQYRFH